MRRLAIALLFVAAPAAAQAPAAMLACVPIVSASERLACFDRAMANASPEARASGERRAAEAAVVAQREAEVAAAAKRDAFGAETLARKDRAPSTDLETVEANITEVLTNAAGDGIFLLDNGQLWKQIDSARLGNIHVGDKVTVTRTGLGGYHLNLVRQKRWLLVKRLR